MSARKGRKQKGSRVSAHTIPQLGAELVSSDGIAFYELIKNAVDALPRSSSTSSCRFRSKRSIRSVLRCPFPISRRKVGWAFPPSRRLS
jgi:hypothetical protein